MSGSYPLDPSGKFINPENNELLVETNLPNPIWQGLFGDRLKDVHFDLLVVSVC